MDNNQNQTNGVNEQPVLQPIINEQPVVSGQPVATQPTSQEIPVSDNGSSEKDNSASRLINDPQGGMGINIGAYEAVKNKPKKEEKVFVDDPHAGSKRAAGFIFLFVLVIFAFFLPKVSDKIADIQGNKEIENLDTGQLRCSMKKNTDNLSITYEQNFKFNKKRIYTYEYKEITEGSKEDYKDINAKDEVCRNLDKTISGASGVSISCDMTTTTASMTQEFNLSEFNSETVISGFTEVGLTYPEFMNNQDVDSVKAKVQSAGYACEKIS